ncbi:hypothetical protein ACLKA7_003467 [Drosophila subpalustris]
MPEQEQLLSDMSRSRAVQSASATASASHTPDQMTPQRHSFPKRSLTLPRILVPQSLTGGSGSGGGGGSGGSNGRGGF